MAVIELRIQEDDCIACEQCVTECEAVFEMAEDKAIIKPEAQNAEALALRSEEILNAANACPSEAIKYQTT